MSTMNVDDVDTMWYKVNSDDNINKNNNTMDYKSNFNG